MLIIILIIIILPANLINLGFLFLIPIHILNSIEDIYTVLLLLKYNKDTLIKEEGLVKKIYKKNN